MATVSVFPSPPDGQIAWCSRCRIEAERLCAPVAGGSHLEDLDPVCERCHGPAELLSPAELHAREQQELAERIAKAQAQVVQPQPRPNGKRPRSNLAVKELLPRAEAARVLGIDEETMLEPMIRAKWIGHVQGPKGPRIPRSEIQRLTTPGGPGLPTREQLDQLLDSKRPPRKVRRAKSRASSGEEGSILDIPLD